MPRLWTFGCSHVESTFNTDLESERWPTMLATRWKMDLENLGQTGGSNDLIVERLLANLQEISDEDRVIILLTYFNRTKVLKENLLPSDKRHEPLYKILLDQPNHFENAAIKNILTITSVLKNRNYMMFAVDDRVITTLTDRGIRFPTDRLFSWPRQTWYNSFDFVDLHLSKIGNIQLADHISQLADKL